MVSNQFNYVDQLSYRVGADGSVELEQDMGAGNIERVFLHRVHLRLLLEEAGYLLPSPPTDELVKRLARQLRDMHEALTTLPEHDSHGVAAILANLTGFLDCLPDNLAHPSPDEVTKHTSPPCQGVRDDNLDFTLTATKE